MTDYKLGRTNLVEVLLDFSGKLQPLGSEAEMRLPLAGLFSFRHGQRFASKVTTAPNPFTGCQLRPVEGYEHAHSVNDFRPNILSPKRHGHYNTNKFSGCRKARARAFGSTAITIFCNVHLRA